MNIDVLVAIVIASGSLLVAIIGGIVTYHTAARKTTLDELKVLIDTLQEEVERLKKERDDCSKRITKIADELQIWKMGVNILIEQIMRAGLQPNWKPPIDKLEIEREK